MARRLALVATLALAGAFVLSGTVVAKDYGDYLAEQQAFAKNSDYDYIPNALDPCTWDYSAADAGAAIPPAVSKTGCKNAVADPDGDMIPTDLDNCAWQDSWDDSGYGFVNNGGCRIADTGQANSDMDNIPDDLDSCKWGPNAGAAAAAAVYGVKNNGCPDTDADGDYIPNRQDSCAWQTVSPGDLVNNKGCKINLDPDGDGLWNMFDPNPWNGNLPPQP